MLHGKKVTDKDNNNSEIQFAGLDKRAAKDAGIIHNNNTHKHNKHERATATVVAEEMKWHWNSNST